MDMNGYMLVVKEKIEGIMNSTGKEECYEEGRGKYPSEERTSKKVDQSGQLTRS